MGIFPELDPLRAHAPESYAAFLSALALSEATLPAAISADVAHRVAAGLGLPTYKPEAATGYGPLVDQFVVYSPGIGAALRDEATAALREDVDLGVFLHAVYVADQTARLRLVLQRLFLPAAEAPNEPTSVPSQTAASALPGAVREMHAAAMRLDRVDPVTTELVRLHAADYHHCRICAAVRLVSATEAGADESFLQQRRDFEASSLSSAHKAALRLADAYMTDPGRIGQSLVDEVRAHFDDAQIVEILLVLSAFNLQKVYVALEIDAPPREGVLTLAFDERGHSLIV